MGLRVGAPIIKNILFFFLGGEIQRDQTPQPFTFIQADYPGNATMARIKQIQPYIIHTCDYDPGGYTDNLPNPDWERKYYTVFNQYELISHEGRAANNSTSEYTFRKPSGDIFYIDDSGLNSTRWQPQLGIRYLFQHKA